MPKITLFRRPIRMGKVLVFAPQYNSVLLDITMDLYSLFEEIFSQNEDPADPVPPNDEVVGDYSTQPCMIL